MSVFDESNAPRPSFQESGWERPTPVIQHSLFPERTEQSLAAARIDANEANDWFASGWLSSMPAFMDGVDEPAWVELLFVRDLAGSGIPPQVISELLRTLPRPLVYDADRVAYSFRYGWVQLPSRPERTPLPENWSIGVVRQWVESAAHRGQVNDLRLLFEEVCKALNAADPD